MKTILHETKITTDIGNALKVIEMVKKLNKEIIMSYQTTQIDVDTKKRYKECSGKYTAKEIELFAKAMIGDEVQ